MVINVKKCYIILNKDGVILMKKVIKINKDLCIGCGLCTTACHNGVIEIIDGKAEIVKKDYCDGLGLCLLDCPTNAINLVDQPEEAGTAGTTNANITKPDAIEVAPMACGCPGTEAKSLKHD